ncbi:MAG: SPOR domain-containing protein [Gallionella sp.]|jgi:cell division protein FtsN
MRENGYNMGRDNGNRSNAPRRGGNSLWAGILAGTIIGVCLAAGVAWYLMKSPSPFTKKEQPALMKPQPDTAKPAVPAATDKSAATTSDGKPRFEFYNVLTNKQNANVTTPTKPAETSKPVENPKAANNKAVPAYEPQILQAGSFSNVSDAEKLKAKLALLGVEANIQTATIPDKGVWYRVRLGPYKSADDMNRASSFLKQNGVDSTPMHTQ